MPAATFAEAQEVLARRLPGYTRREHQMRLAEVIEKSIEENRPLLAQAGTGTGKSLALLIPAILAGGRTVVATFNKALQSQYALKDLPFLKEHLGTDFEWAVLKGRANYPCLARAQEIASPTPRQSEVLTRIGELVTPQAIADLEITDREDFPLLPDEEWRPFSMSSSECPGKKACPFGAQCIAERAKEKAAAADVVITNTAFLVQDLIIRNQTDESFSLLGEIDRLIVDEAHTLPDVATSALEDTMGERTFEVLARDMGAYLYNSGADETISYAIEEQAKGLWAQLSLRYSDFAARAKGKTDPMPLHQAVLIGELGPHFIGLFRAIETARNAIKATPVPEDNFEYNLRNRLLRRSASQMDRIEAITTDPDEKTIRWAELESKVIRGERRERLYLRSAPVSVGPFLRAALWNRVPAILASATLAPGGSFAYLSESLGLRKDEAMTFDAGTPFDYKSQAMLYVPGKDAPEPSGKNVPAWRVYAQEVTHRLVSRSAGGALLLFTSRSAMNESYDALAGRLRMQGLTVLRQGDAPNPELIRAFKEDGNAVLFALRTFFEGVDIQGSALRLVVLDKLPFAVPTDLLYQARCELINRKYGDSRASFDRLTVPAMILVLLQGFGRLIRHRDDRGVVAILDNRLRTKGYGRKIMNALPPAAQTEDFEAAGTFLERSA